MKPRRSPKQLTALLLLLYSLVQRAAGAKFSNDTQILLVVVLKRLVAAHNVGMLQRAQNVGLLQRHRSLAVERNALQNSV